MTHTRWNRGTCSAQTLVELNDDHTIARMKGTTCGFRPTSCPDQIALALEEALTKL